jgi:hypothetical protein
VETLIAVKCTPLHLQMSTLGPAQNAGQGTTAGTGRGGSVTPALKTNAKKLAKALRACKRKPKRQRASCEKQAHKKYRAIRR